jgi:hypothetical protein
MNSKRTYVALGTLFVISVVGYVLLPVGAIQNIAAIPAIGALCAALFLILRDRVAHERAMFTLEVQNSFAIGAMSHLANVTFDKHVLFCEEYVAEMFDTLNTLFKQGPHRDALKHAGALFGIRRKWSVWLTPEVQAKLEQFEVAIRKIGNDERLVSDFPGMDQRQRLIDEMYALLAEVIGEKEWQGKTIKGDLAISSVMGKLREVLGIDELTVIRTRLIKRAAESLKDPTLKI